MTSSSATTVSTSSASATAAAATLAAVRSLLLSGMTKVAGLGRLQ